MNSEIHRPRLNRWEVAILRNLLDDQLRHERRNIGYKKKRIAGGEPDSRVYPLAEQERYLRKMNRLRKKLNSLLT